MNLGIFFPLGTVWIPVLLVYNYVNLRKFIFLTEFPEVMNRDNKIPSSITHLTSYSSYILHVVRYFPFSEFKFSHHFSKKASLTDFSVPTPRIFWVNMFCSAFIAFPSHNTNCLKCNCLFTFVNAKRQRAWVEGSTMFH